MNYTRKEVAKNLNISQRSVDRLILTGQLKAYKIGRSVRISKEQLDDFLKGSVYDPLEPGEVKLSSEINLL